MMERADNRGRGVFDRRRPPDVRREIRQAERGILTHVVRCGKELCVSARLEDWMR